MKVPIKSIKIDVGEPDGDMLAVSTTDLGQQCNLESIQQAISEALMIPKELLVSNEMTRSRLIPTRYGLLTVSDLDYALRTGACPPCQPYRSSVNVSPGRKHVDCKVRSALRMLPGGTNK
jgi:hypothetical protein